MSICSFRPTPIRCRLLSPGSSKGAPLTCCEKSSPIKRWQQARAILKVHKQERYALFSQLRQEYGFSEYALHAYATKARTAWIADHLDSNTAQKLASRAYQAANRVCLGQAKKVRFKSRGRGLDSVEGKTNKQGLRFVLQAPEEGNAGWLIWQQDHLPALIDWHDPLIKHGLSHPIKYVRLLRRRASSPQAQGADGEGYRYSAQLAVEGVPYQKPNHQVGTAALGLDLGPSTLAMVPEQGEAGWLACLLAVRNSKPTNRRNGVSNVNSTDNDEPITHRTMMQKAASRRASCAGMTVKDTRKRVED
jgi:hypothetical protein